MSAAEAMAAANDAMQDVEIAQPPRKRYSTASTNAVALLKSIEAELDEAEAILNVEENVLASMGYGKVAALKATVAQLHGKLEKCQNLRNLTRL